MKSLNSKLLTLAATLAIAATTASAQTSMRASIPFSFEVSGHHVLAAGTYDVHRTGYVWRFTSRETRHEALIAGAIFTGSNPADNPALVFSCRGNRCSLQDIRIGRGSLGGSWPGPRLSKSDQNELSRIVVVPLTSTAD